MSERIICQRCIYYFVTWQADKPHGCKSYGFKSSVIPSVLVKRSSKQDCNFYKQKQR